jgi:CheY-like chemotaxis protein
MVPKILIVDDDPAIMRFLAKRCANMGFKVQTANIGLEALMRARGAHSDVLISDVMMPDLDGLSLSAHLLEGDRALKVIVMTASSDPQFAARCESLGAYYVRKGAGLWDGVRSALIELFPDMAKDSGNEKAGIEIANWIRNFWRG